MSLPATPNQDPFALTVVSAGTSDPSSSRLLADRTATAVAATARERGREVRATVVDLRQIAGEVTSALTSNVLGPGLTAAVDALRGADGLIVSTPVYSAGPSGLFTSFFQVIDNDLIIAKPVILAATAGSPRHALVVDEQMRSHFAYLRTLSVPTSLFAANEDWGDSALGVRIDRAALELVLLMESGFAQQVRETSWRDYRHDEGALIDDATGFDLDPDMMRLAAGGSLGGEDRQPE
jgi:FMN reductase